MKAFLDWKHITFAQPVFFALLLLIPFMIWWQWSSKKNDSPSLRLTTLGGINKAMAGSKAKFRPILFILRVVALMALTVALARPQSSNTTENIDSEGIDIVLAMD